MHTTDGMAFWMEWGDDGLPRLYMDTTTTGGGMNALCIHFCPICGNQIKMQEADNYEPEE